MSDTIKTTITTRDVQAATRRIARKAALSLIRDRVPAPFVPGAWAPRGPRNGLTLIDFLCGAGGSAAGLSNAGWDLRGAINHWQVAINTHQANFPNVWHACVDITTVNMRSLPRTNALWASPICTESSPAGGNHSGGWKESDLSLRGQGSLFDEKPVEQAGMEKTRATFWSVIQYVEMWRPEVAFVENVPDVIRKWALFKNWLGCMETLGYTWQLVNVNSAHIGDLERGIPYAPQWRDRMYIIFVRKDIHRVPDVTPRPKSYCWSCREVVEGVQTWCPAAKTHWLKHGRYRRDPATTYGSYWYTCPRGCRNPEGGPARVEPFILPASTAIDWADLGEPIADGQLVANSLRRIATGQDMFWPVSNGGRPVFVANATHEDTRVYLVDGAPMTARTQKIGDGLCLPPYSMIPGGRWPSDPMSVDEPMRTQLANGKGSETLITPDPFVAIWRNHTDAIGTDEPMPTLTAAGHHHSLVSPPEGAYQVTHCGGEARPENLCHTVGEPMGTVVASGAHHALVLPYYAKDPAGTADEPLGTVPTRDRFGLAQPAGDPLETRDVRAKGGGTVRLRSCRHRMFRWDESARAQVLPIDDGYQITGTGEERTAQAGNAVTSNAAQWLGYAAAEILV